MSRPASPSMPTERQIKDAFEAVKKVCPNARIARIGPEGVTFDYPKGNNSDADWQGKAFAAE